jgi:hypothetical protein
MKGDGTFFMDDWDDIVSVLKRPWCAEDIKEEIL